LKVGFNDKAIVEATKYFGYFALLSNQAMETFTALEDYRLREKIEELFAVIKGGLDGVRPPRTWYPDNLRGRLSVYYRTKCIILACSTAAVYTGELLSGVFMHTKSFYL
jgi:hypothetical protein